MVCAPVLVTVYTTTALTMARILAILPDYPPLHRGGWEWGAYEVNEAWTRAGHEVIVLTTRVVNSPEELSTRQLVRRLLPTPLPGCWHTDVSLGKRIALRNFARESLHILQDTIDDVAPSFVMVWILSSYPTSFLNELRKRRIPYLHYLSNYGAPTQLFRHAKMMGRLKREFGRWWLKAGTTNRRHVDWSRTVYCSDYVRNYYTSMDGKCASGHVVHWGVDLGRFRAAERAADGVGPLRLIWAGRISREKGLHVALQAMTLISAETATLDIYGCLDDQAYYRTHIEPALRENIHYCGFLQRGEIAEKFSKSDAFVFTSIWPEPFSVVVLEALAAGLPVLATDTGGTKEALNESCALFTPVGDSEALAALIHALAADRPRLRRLQSAASRRSASFTVQGMASGLLNLA